MSWEQPAEFSHIWVSGNKTPHIGKQISNCQNKCKFEFTVMCAFLGPNLAPCAARRDVRALPECEYSLPVAHGRLCVLASSQSARLHWLHKHTGRAWSLGFVALGSKAESVWCGIFPWQMEPGIDFFTSLCTLACCDSTGKPPYYYE